MPPRQAPAIAFVGALLLLGTHAWSAPREVVALHPLVVVGGEPADDWLHSLFTAEVARIDVELVGSEQVRQFLKSQRNQSCIGDDGCLANLAKATGATRTVLVTISPYSPKLVLTGRVVSASGAVIRSLPSREYPRGKSKNEATQAALRAFLKELDVTALELAPLAATTQPEPPKKPEPVAEPVTVTRVEPPPVNTLRTASYVAWGVGAAALAGAGAVRLTSESTVQELRASMGGSSNVPQDAKSQELARTLRSREQVATGLLIGAGAALATGTILFFVSDGPGAPSVAFSPQLDGAAAFVAWSF